MVSGIMSQVVCVTDRSYVTVTVYRVQDLKESVSRTSEA